MASSYPKVLYTGTQAAYNALETKSADVLYWTSDTHKVYKGSVDFSEYVKAVATRPTAVADLAAGTLYLCADTGKAEFYDGTAWHTLNLPETTAFTGTTADDAHVPTTKAVKDYVASVIGGSSDVVKSVVAKANAAGTLVVTQADNTSSDVTVHDVFTTIADKMNGEATVAGAFTLTDTDGDTTDYTVKGVGTTLAAGANAAQVSLSKTSGSADTVTVPGVVTGLAADATDAATVNITTSTGTHADVVVPKVVTGLAAGSADGQVAVTLSSGTHAAVTVPGVFTAVAWDSSARTLTFTDSDGVSTGTDHVVDLGKDIFIDQNAPNRYENGNIYLYLNDGATTSQDTEIVIPVTGLITDYIGTDTDTIDVTVNSTTHAVSADVIVRPDVAGTFTNALKVSSTAGAKGLYVDTSDIEESIDALAAAITWGTF